MTLNTDTDIDKQIETGIQQVTDAEVEAAIRIEQSMTLVRLSPLMMLSNLLVPAILCLSVLPLLPHWFMPGWLLILTLMNAPILISWLRLRTQLEHGTQSIEIERRRPAEARLQKSLKELNETPDKLILQEKMASLGAVTAGVAHEIKNPLNFIINFAKLSRDLYKDVQASAEPAMAHL